MEFYKLFIEQSPNAVAMFDQNIQYIFASDQWLKDYSLTGQSIIGKSFYEVFPDIGGNLKRIHQECLAGATNICEGAEFINKDGESTWIKWLVKPWYNEKGIGGILMSTGDITKQKNLEKDLDLERRQFQGAFETASIGMAIVSLDGKWLKVNASLLKLLGYSESELLERTFQQITHPEDLQRDLHILQRLLDGQQENYEMEKRYIHKNGSIIWAILAVSIVKDALGKPIHFVSQILDISMNKKIEQTRITELDKDRSRIAFELHENIAQSIAAIKMIVQFGKENDHNIDSKLSMLIEDIKQLSAQIMPSTFHKEDLLELISNLVSKVTQQHKIEVKANLDPELKYLYLSDNFHVFKIIEGLVQLALSCNMRCARLKIIIGGELKISFEPEWQKEIDDLTTVEELLIRNIKTRTDILEGDFYDSGLLSELQAKFDIRIPAYKLIKAR